MTHRQRLTMIVFTVLAAMGLTFAGPGVASAAPSPPAAAAPVSALATPVTGTGDNGSFDGTFTPTSFTEQDGQLLANGVLTGTVKDTDGDTVGTVTRNISAPAAIAAATCQVLHLVLGPLHLDLLGLTIDLNRVNLLINAVAAPGNLLGNLLCAIVHLLDGNPTAGGLAALLNSILALLGQP